MGAMRLVAIASTLGVSVATSPSVDASLIQVQREILREGQASSGYERSSSGSSTSLYVFVKFGTCDDYGYEFITTKAECQAAGTQLGVVRRPLTPKTIKIKLRRLNVAHARLVRANEANHY